ncbi:MAG: tetratricopeptide repeat protein [Myxococcota bacterium]|nr:tetratricopeptide repeat protein [Myxococcota bacterium]
MSADALRSPRVLADRNLSSFSDRGKKAVIRVLSTPVSSYTLRDAARILKVSPARLRYWARTELLSAAGVEAKASEDRGLGFTDLVVARAVLALLKQGVSLQQIRRGLDSVQADALESDSPLSALRLSQTGHRRLLVRSGSAWVEAGGQGVLDFEGGDEPLGGLETLDPQKKRDGGAEDVEGLFARGCSLDGDSATYGEAIECYREAIEIDPDFADCHCNLGAVYYNRGDRGPARESFARCLDLAPHHVEANFNLANLLEEEGDDHGALRHYKVALAVAPLYADLQINLALLYEKLGEKGRARKHWRRYLQLDSAGAWSELARLRLAPNED